MTSYTNHEKTSSADRNSGRKSKLIGKYCRLLLRNVSENNRTTEEKVRAELNIHRDDPVSKKTLRRELHKSNIPGRAAIAVASDS